VRKSSEQVSIHIVNACIIASELRQECPGHQGVERIARAYREQVDELSTDDVRSTTSLEVLKLSEMVRSGDPSEVLSKAQGMWGDPAYSFHRITILRFMVEVNIELRNWDEAKELLDRFAECVERGGVSYLDVNSLVSNVAAYCVGFALANDSRATDTLSAVLAIADLYERNGHRLMPGDLARVQVCRAYVAALSGDFEPARRILPTVELDELTLSEAGRAVGADHLCRLMLRWVRTMPSAVVPTESLDGS
jgi:hypothetical protein